jgi:hypothetical protein
LVVHGRRVRVEGALISPRLDNREVILSVALQDVESQVAVVLSAVIRQPLQQPGASLCGDGIVSTCVTT